MRWIIRLPLLLNFSMLAHEAFCQIACAPLPSPGSTVEVNINSFASFNLRCVYLKKTPDDSLTATTINQIAQWKFNGKEIVQGQQTQWGSIFFTADKKLMYRAPARKPANGTITLTAEYTHHKNQNKKNIYFWTIKIKDDAYTEVHLEDATTTMKIKTESGQGFDMKKNLAAYENRLSAEAKAKLQQVRSEHPEFLDMNKYRSNTQAAFIEENNKKHFVITVYDPKHPAAGSLAFELPGTLLKTYETNSTNCKAAIGYGITNCKIQVETKGYVHETSDGQGNTVEGLLRITLTEVGQPGQYVKGTFIGTLATYSKDCQTTSSGGHYHPIELREAYGSFVAVRQVNISKK